ncbi:MAG: hypothetical protein LBU87_03770 [Lactobacillales bacterium]|jgi:hypothetical protein|nr:hypothetical protein [Lactobacillales bacterium]
MFSPWIAQMISRTGLPVPFSSQKYDKNYPSKSKTVRGHFKNGQLEGKFESQIGDHHRVKHYKNGVLNGSFEVSNTRTGDAETGKYVDGVKSGPYTILRSDIQEEGTYVNGARQGLYTMRKRGRIYETGVYKEGRKIPHRPRTKNTDCHVRTFTKIIRTAMSAVTHALPSRPSSHEM